MTVIAFTSAKGSPGVSTVVLGLGAVWTQTQPERRVLVVEADPAGGEAAVGLLQGQRRRRRADSWLSPPCAASTPSQRCGVSSSPSTRRSVTCSCSA